MLGLYNNKSIEQTRPLKGVWYVDLMDSYLTSMHSKALRPHLLSITMTPRVYQILELVQ